jgi:hypothetical protein
MSVYALWIKKWNIFNKIQEMTYFS